MKKDGLKSIWSVLAGFIFVVVASIATDLILLKAEAMKHPFHQNSTIVIAVVVLYRCMYGTAGAWLTTKLAPFNPMKHALTGGAIGTVIATIGAIAMWDTPPHWYAIALIVTALPCSWLGAYVHIKLKQHETRELPGIRSHGTGCGR